MGKSTNRVTRQKDLPKQHGTGEGMPPCLARWPGFVLGWVSGIGLRYYEDLLAPLGLKAGHAAVLTLLSGEGDIVQARLGERLHIDKATMVAILSELERRKLVVRRPHADDKRALVVTLLRAGARKVQELERLSDDGTRQFFGIFTTEEQKQFHALLTRIAERGYQKAESE